MREMLSRDQKSLAIQPLQSLSSPRGWAFIHRHCCAFAITIPLLMTHVVVISALKGNTRGQEGKWPLPRLGTG